MFNVNFKKSPCHPVDFKKFPCHPVDFKKFPCHPVDFKSILCPCPISLYFKSYHMSIKHVSALSVLGVLDMKSLKQLNDNLKKP